jgi:type I restriction enzyme S subunit
MVPPLSIQREATGVLRAYDDLIETNERRIHILKKMAQSLYREWFVDYRFPGYEKAEFVRTPSGTIPSGWTVEKLGDVLELNYGKALRYDERRQGPIPVFGSSGVIGYHDTSLVKGPGIVVGRKGNVGTVFWSDDDFHAIDTVYYVSSKLPLRFLFYDLQTKNFINNDAAVPGLNRDQAYALETVVPTAKVLDRFVKLADDFEQQAARLQKQNVNLLQTRDVLLPQLTSERISLPSETRH